MFLRMIFFVAAALAMSQAAAAEWHEAKSKHFIIYADMKPDQLRTYTERLERFDAAIRRLRSMDDPQLTDSGRVTLYMLPSAAAVGRLMGRKSVAGVYFPRVSGVVSFVPRAAKQDSIFDLDSQTILFHEYAHHLQLHDNNLALPVWVREGFAEFFSTADVKQDGSVVIGSPPLHRTWGLRSPRQVRIEDLLSGPNYGGDGAMIDSFYGRGWLLTHYLTFNSERTGQLRRYIDAIQQGVPPLDAAQEAFGDLRALDRELNRYLESRFAALTIAGNTLNVAPAQVRKMTAGESAIMNVRIRSKFGVNSKTAPEVAADARKIAAGFPNDPFVQATLAEAEHDAGELAAADAAADRALATDPDNVHALIYKGRIAMRQATTDKAKADWKSVRRWFQKANKLDNDNSEALFLFYLSYTAAEQPPTKSAVDALLYSVDLVPQDSQTRMMAVFQLLRDGRAAEARNRFRPIAFNPHAPEQWRKKGGDAMAAMEKGDSQAALKVLETPEPESEK